MVAVQLLTIPQPIRPIIYPYIVHWLPWTFTIYLLDCTPSSFQDSLITHPVHTLQMLFPDFVVKSEDTQLMSYIIIVQVTGYSNTFSHRLLKFNIC